MARPRECAAFYCAWRLWPALGERWFPAESHLMVLLSPQERHLMVKVDPDWPEAWKQVHYYDDIKRMAQDMVPRGFKVAVQIGERLIFILPERDVDIGVVAENETVEFRQIATPSGPQLDVRKVRI